MSKMLPYQLLLETKGIDEKDLPKEVKAKIKKMEATLRGVANFGKKDENGDYIVSSTTQEKIKNLDKELVGMIWDYLDSSNEPTPNTTPSAEPKKEEKPNTTPTPQPSTEPTPSAEPKKEEVEPTPKKEEEPKKESTGRIGFFDF